MYSFIKQVSFCIALVGTLAVSSQVQGSEPGPLKTGKGIESKIAFVRTRTANGSSFMLGKEFVVARMSAISMSSDRAAFHSAAVDLMYLIESLGSAAETAELREVLRSMLKGEIKPTAASAKIDSVLGQYSRRQPVDSRWYLETGVVVASSVYSSFYSDAESLGRDLNALKLQLERSPRTVKPELVTALAGLCEKGKATMLDHEDFEAITKLGLAIFSQIEN